MKKLLATLLAVSTFCVIGGAANPPDQGSGADFSLIEYLETHEIDSYEEFIDVIKEVSPESVDEKDIDSREVTSFSIDIDYDNEIVSVVTLGEATYDRSHGASNSASKSYYASNGLKIFTINVEGTFSYSSTSCTTLSADGSYQRALLSTWSSTPALSSGNINTGKAYAKISGTARSGSDSKYYSLTLTCDTSGNFTSY